MQRYIAKRFLQALLSLFAIAVIVFLASRALGNPIDLMLPADAPEAARQQLAAALGLDKPYVIQFYYFLRDAIRGDFGVSIRYNVPALGLFLTALPNSLQLIGLAFVFSLAMAIPLGVIAAVKLGTYVDTICKVIAVTGMSLPTFWVGMVLVQIFSVGLNVLPVARMGGPSHYILPAFTLGFYLMAGQMRLLRSSMIEVQGSEYVKFARIKGLSERIVIWKHSLRNALIPLVSFVGVYTAILITGTIVVETVFAWPGVGRLAYQGVMFRDFPIIQTVVILKASLVLVITLIVDILYAYLDPRIRY